MILQGVTYIDPSGSLARDQRIELADGQEVIDARGLIFAPGFVDLHAHLREPGFEESETIGTGARAALRGGFTTVCAMPNTDPAIDSPGLVAEVIARSEAARGARVLPIAAITRGRQGRELADLMELSAAGAVAFSDDGDPVEDARLFRSALEYARAAGRLVIEHSQDRALSQRGLMNEGAVSARLGLAGSPGASEEVAVARDIALAELAGARLHLAHVSTAGSVELVRRAKARGVAVSAEVTPHHLAMTEDWVAGSRRLAWEETSVDGTPYDTSTKVSPPLRTLEDVRACWEGLRDGSIDAIATDHAPHASVRKDVEYGEAAFGISGLETALPLLLSAVAAGWADIGMVIRALTGGPAVVLGLDAPPLIDRVLIAPDAEWTVSPETLVSKGKNTPLLGRTLRGRVVLAMVGGEIRYADEGYLKGLARAATPAG